MTARMTMPSALVMGVVLALAATPLPGNPAAAQPRADRQVASAAASVEAPKTFHGIGFVTAIEANGSLTINHQPIEGLMPAMEMMFPVARQALAAGVRPGDEVEFNVEAKTYVITGLKVVGHTR